MTQTEKIFISALSDNLYTPDFVEEWISRNDNVFVNAPAALQAMEAKGFYRAVQLILSKPLGFSFIGAFTCEGCLHWEDSNYIKCQDCMRTYRDHYTPAADDVKIEKE